MRQLKENETMWMNRHSALGVEHHDIATCVKCHLPSLIPSSNFYEFRFCPMCGRKIVNNDQNL